MTGVGVHVEEDSLVELEDVVCNVDEVEEEDEDSEELVTLFAEDVGVKTIVTGSGSGVAVTVTCAGAEVVGVGVGVGVEDVAAALLAPFVPDAAIFN